MNLTPPAAFFSSIKQSIFRVNISIPQDRTSLSYFLVQDVSPLFVPLDRLPVDPQGTRPLPSVPSKKASFTIRLFQMINYSTAYLHCDLSVCLRNNSECERQCIERRNARPVGRVVDIFRSAVNRISFGPVLKGIDNSSLSEAAAETEAVMVIMGSVAGCLMACLALLLVWMAHRRCLNGSGCCWSGALCEC